MGRITCCPQVRCERKVLANDRITRIAKVTPKEQQYLCLSVDHFTSELRISLLNRALQ